MIGGMRIVGGDIIPIGSEDLNIILDRINNWINNCDTKSSIVLSFIGILLGIIFTTDYITKLFEIYKKIYLSTNLVNLLFLLFSIGSIICIIKGIIYLILSIHAKTNINNEYGLITDSLIYYKTITGISNYKEYEEKINELNQDTLKKEIISQIYINSEICTKKIKNYNIGLEYSIIGISIFLILMIIGYLTY